MPLVAAFHDVSFPVSIALGATGGPERRTDIVTLGSGREVRNARWADSRRRWDAGSGVKTLDELHAVIAFFEERRGRLHAFRFRDRVDCRSGPPGTATAAGDQRIGTGDGTTRAFQLVKRYGGSFAPFDRTIDKPVAGSVSVAVAGTALTAGAFSVAAGTGVVTLTTAPAAGAAVTAGFTFDVAARFDTDHLAIDLSAFAAGEIPSIPLVEVRL